MTTNCTCVSFFECGIIKVQKKWQKVELSINRMEIFTIKQNEKYLADKVHSNIGKNEFYFTQETRNNFPMNPII